MTNVTELENKREQRTKLTTYSSLLILFFTFILQINAEPAKGTIPFGEPNQSTNINVGNLYIDAGLIDLVDLLDEPLDNTTLQLFTHGRPGELLIEDVWLDAPQILTWLNTNHSLKSKTALNIYGCNFAQGETGRAAVEYLEAALGISVAASDDITGRDGDWDLEVGNPIASVAVPDYPFNLQTCSGNADMVVSNSGFTNPNDALGAVDGDYAVRSGGGGAIVLDLTDILDAGASIMTTIEVTGSSMTIEESSDAVTWSNSTSYSANNPTYTTAASTRYIRISNTGFGIVLIDAISYTNQACGGGGGGGSSTCSPMFVARTENAVSANNISMTVPAGAMTGDLLITAIAVDGEQNMPAPAGWTQINDANYSPNLMVFHRTVDGTESSSYSFTLSGSQNMAGTMLLYTQVSASPINVIDFVTGGASPAVAPSVTSTTDNNLVLRMAGIRDDSFGTFAGTTTRSGHSFDIDVSILIGEEAQATAGATGTSSAAAARHTAVTLVISGGNCGGSGNVSTGTIFPPADYTINTGGTQNVCTGIFADSGDTNGDYSDSESHTMTFCSDQNNHISFTFEHFNTEATNDVLTIYDGNSTGVTSLGSFSGFGTANAPGVVTSSGTCLTFQFNSNGSTTSPGWLAKISCTGTPPSTATAPSWTGYPTGSACASNAQIGGKVYEDIDQDGVEDAFDPPLFGINVYLFDDNGQVGGVATTDANGEYTFNGLTASTVYRVEFEVPSNWKEGPYGAESGTNVQFVEAGRCDANLGLIDVAHYCSEADPYWIIPCYNNGDPQHSSNVNGTAVARFRYSDSGNSPTATYTNYVTLGAVGSTWGVAFDEGEQNLYLSTVLKRHVGIGPGGIGAIYRHTDGNASNSATVFYDFGVDAGTVDNNNTRFPGSGNGSGQQGSCGTCDNIDPNTFGQTGKVGFGDIETNPDNSKLYVTNLFDRKVYAIDIDNPTPGSATPLPGMPWLDNSVCSNGVARPWALEWRRNKLYVGVICDASLSSCSIGSACSDLTAEVFSFDGTTWTNELSVSLDYYRQAYSKGSDYFVKWLDNWSDMSAFVSNVTDANFAQPILMDIEFDDDNSMILGIGDRSGLQMGYQAPPPPGPISSTAERNMAFGDILRAGYNPAANDFTIENNGTVGGLTTTNPTGNSGPGGKSFYWGDYWTGIGANKYQGGIGSLGLLPGSGEVMFPIGDAIDYYSNGVIWMNNSNGSANKKLEVYQGVSNGSAANFSKGTGVGDIDFMCAAEPNIEIGNIVWWDEDLDGLQDPSEPGITNVTLELWLDPNGNTQGNNAMDGDEIKVAETTTDTYGRYIFSYTGNSNGLNAENWSFTANNKVLANTSYQVRIPNWETDAGLVAYRNSLGYTAHLLSPTQNQTGMTGALGTGRDNNGYDNPGNAAGAVQTGSNGDNDHNFDFAFGGVGGCEAPEVIPTANTPCKGETLNFMAAVSGGSSPYTYSWTGPNSFTSVVQNPSIADADSTLHAGIYSLAVMDNAGCTDTVHIHVTVNDVKAAIATTDATCGSSDGAADVTVSKGFAPFTYAWSNSETTEDLTGLAAGSYTVTITDADGCTTTEVAGINSSGAVTLAETHVDASCGNSNGSIDLTITGTPSSISWSNGATTEDISGLAAGTYAVTVNNASGCQAFLSVTLTDTPVPTVSTTQVNTTCGSNNGSIDLTVSGGTAPYTFQWDNDGTADNDDVEDVSALTAGTYNVTVTDANNCTATTSVVLTDTPGPTLSTTPTNENCGQSDGSINLTVSGGTAPFTYAWNNGLTTEDISGIGAGTFTVTVTDANGCTATTSETIANTPGPTLSAIPTDATDCNRSDGSIDLSVTGGTGPYTFAWDNGATTEDISGLVAGSYQATVTDANGCIEYISAGVGNAADPVLDLAVTDPVNCGDTGDVDLTITGGTAPYAIDWSTDGLGDNDDTEDQTGLEGGVYDLVVTDAIGCPVTAKASIKIVRAPALSGVLTAPNCGSSDGAIDLVISDPDAGSSPTYNFIWSNGATTEDISGLSAGNYSVTVSNNINCISEIEFSLSDNGSPTLSITQNNPTCNGNNGFIDLIASGGTTPYSFAWNDGTTTEDRTMVMNGTYSVTVTDNAGCNAAISTVLVSSEPPILNGIVANETCGNGDGGINLIVDGAGPLTYDWNDNTLDGMEDPTGLSVGNYTVTVTDANGCTAERTFMVDDFCPCTSPTVSAFAIQPSCVDGVAQMDGYLQLSQVTNGDRYHFSSGSTFDDNGGANTYANATSLSAATYPVQFNTGLSNTDAGDFTIRIYNGAGDCFTDVVVTLVAQDCTVGCDCNDYLYLNDVPLSEVHKFEVLSDGSLTEVGSPWLGSTPAPGPQFAEPAYLPHGIATDNNGFIYVGDVLNFTNNDGGLVKLTCDGSVVEDNVPGIPRWGYNIGATDNSIYIPNQQGNVIYVYDVCQGTATDTITASYPIGWGFTISSDEQCYYYTTGWGNGGTNKVIKGNLDGTGTEQIIYDNGETWGAFMGITQDNLGNLYVVRAANRTAADNGIGNAIILKISSTGTLLGTSDWDGTLTQNDGQTSGYNGARGIVWSPEANRLYVGSQEDCISVFDISPDTLVYRPDLSIGYVTGSEPKGIGVMTECCPTNNNIVVDTTLCAAQVNDVLFLQDLINCDGTICEGMWQEGTNTGLIYDNCDNSVTINTLNACGTFTLESDGTGSNPQCGAFKITVNIKVGNVTAPVIGNDQMVCSGEVPATITATTPATGSSTIDYQWQSSTTDCTSGFLNIDGAISDSYSPSALTQTTYYRVISSVSGLSCSNGICADTSNCVTITINSNPTVTVNSPTICNEDSETITASPSGGSGNYSYAWTVPAGESNPGNVASYTATQAGTHSVTVTDDNGCTATGDGTLTERAKPCFNIAIEQH